MRSAFYLIALIAIVWSLRSIEIIPEFLYDAPQQTADLFARMWPIDWAWYPKVVHAALMETLHTATLGTILAVAMAAPVALMVARNVTQSVILQSIGRFILVATRSVHAMVWALFFVAVFGPGALAGTLAIAVHSIGFTGKFLSEAIEEAKPGPIEALEGRRRPAARRPHQGGMAAGEAGLPGDRHVPLGHQCARIRRARPGRRRRARHGARYRAFQPLLGPGRVGAVRDLRRRHRGRNRHLMGAQPDHLKGLGAAWTGLIDQLRRHTQASAATMLNSRAPFAIRAFGLRRGNGTGTGACRPPCPAGRAAKILLLQQRLAMPSTFETVANIIAETCDIPRETIKPESHSINDLGIDSLDFLDIAFAIDKAFGIKLPLEHWTQEVNDGKATTEQYFVLKNLCARIDDLVAAKGA